MFKLLVGCEHSGTVRNAFLDEGVDAYSCDLLPDEGGHPDRHFQMDLLDHIYSGVNHYTAMIAHPDCTYLCNSGVRWLTDERYPDRWEQMQQGANFFSACYEAPIEYKCIENSIMHSHAKEAIDNYVDYTQLVRPTDFGGTETKGTCLWLVKFKKLYSTTVIRDDQITDEIHRAPPGPDRWKFRSKFDPKMAAAMAKQWTKQIKEEKGL